jgi:hypothetical protein
MPSEKDRINLTLPPDLQDLVEKEAEEMDIGAATRVTQIVRQHYRRMAAEATRSFKVLKGSELLGGRSELTMDFSGEADRERARADEQSSGEGGV